jgi:hypothetical protein
MGEDMCNSDTQGEKKGNGPYQGPLGTSGEITEHKEMRMKISERGGAI